MKSKGFREKLAVRQEKVDSLVCVGLDPLPEKLPGCILARSELKLWEKIAYWMVNIVAATASYASLFKLQRAHYEAINEGEQALRYIIRYIHKNYPDIPVFVDCKRGDIGRTQKRYRAAHFELDGADGINFNPYMGRDCFEALVDLENPGRAIVGLCYTSNPAAREVQDVRLASGEFYWEFIAKSILTWARESGVLDSAGLVMAAAYEKPKGSGKIFSYHLKRVRELVGNSLWFLIPGIGTQGGFVKETVKAAYVEPGSIAINSSSAIIFASIGDDYDLAAAQEAKKLRDTIRKAIYNFKIRR